MKMTWYGHSCFKVETAASRIMIDPFMKSSPTFQASGVDFDEAIEGVTHVALTHGHDDHIGDTVEICQKTGATLMAVFELAMHLKNQGAENIEPMNTGGGVASGDFTLTMTDALHSSSSGGVYLGNPCGLIISPQTGPVVYHMGDTDVFPGMSIINDLYQPAVGIVPIGDRFTMGARTAVDACEKFFQFSHVLPCHYGTFPILDATADGFVAHMTGPTVHVPEVGGAIEV